MGSAHSLRKKLAPAWGHLQIWCNHLIRKRQVNLKGDFQLAGMSFLSVVGVACPKCISLKVQFFSPSSQKHLSKLFITLLQEKLLGLMSLPTKEQFEELKKKRKQDLEQKRTMERQVHGAQAPSGFDFPALIPYPLAAKSLHFKLASVWP